MGVSISRMRVRIMGVAKDVVYGRPRVAGQRSSQQGRREMSRVIVKNLPPKTTEKTLSDLFSQCGEVTDARLIRTRAGASRRFGFVGLVTEAQARRAVEMFDRSFVGSARISVETAKPYGDESLGRPWSKYSKGSSAFAKKGRRKEEEEGDGGPKKVRKEKKPTAALAELCEVEEDEEFREFLSVHTHKSHVHTWADEGVGASETKREKKSSGKRRGVSGEVEEEVKKVSKDKKKKKGKELTGKGLAGSAGESSCEEDMEEEREGEGEVEQKDGSGEAAIGGTDMDYLRSKVVEKLTEADRNSETVGDDSTEEDDDSTDDDSEGVKSNEEEAPANQGSNEFSSTLFTLRMRGLPFKSTREDVETFFHPLPLADVRFTTDRDGRPSGRAYVDFNTGEEMTEGLKRSGDCIGKRYIELFHDEGPKSVQCETEQETKREFVGRTPHEGEEEEDESIADSGRLFLRNLSFTVTEDNLTETFERFGPLTEVTVPLDKNTNRPTGLGFVTFMLPEHAVRAYEELDGQVYQGRLLHILPARPRRGRPTQEDEEKDGGAPSFKKKKERERKSKAGSSHNWNTLFLGANSVVDAMSRRYSTTKSSILDPESDRSVAVRMALGETQIVSETREFLEAEGVHLDVFEKKNPKRSSAVVLIKNLPHGTKRSELEEVFTPFGALHKLIFPPSGISALVEFLEPSHAKEAFKRLAYSKFKHLPLYLEWAPIGVMGQRKPKEEMHVEVGKGEGGKGVGEGGKGEGEGGDGVGEGMREEGEGEEGCTLFVKNLNFSSDESSLRNVFSRVGGLTKVEIARKKNMKDPSHPLSMGFGFVEFSTPELAQQALKDLQHTDLDGHSLELKLSHRSNSRNSGKISRKSTEKREQKSAKIMVRNIPFEATQREVRELFQTFGQLKTVRLPKKMAAVGRHRGFGFVEFMTNEDAKRAFESLCYSTHLYGRRLVLEWAEGAESIEEIRKRTAEHFHGLQAAGVSSKRRKAEFLLYGNSVDSKDVD